jgi:single-stranded DNA-binding protein
MLNNLILIGKIVNLPKKLKTDEIWCTFEIQLERPYKNRFGKFITDNFQIKIWKEIIKPFLKSLKVNDLLVVRGRLEINEDNKKLEIIADYLTPLLSNSIN